MARRGSSIDGPGHGILFFDLHGCSLVAFCHVGVRSAEIGPQPLTVYLSLNYIAEHGLQVGSRLPLRVMPERMRFF